MICFLDSGCLIRVDAPGFEPAVPSYCPGYQGAMGRGIIREMASANRRAGPGTRFPDSRTFKVNAGLPSAASSSATATGSFSVTASSSTAAIISVASVITIAAASVIAVVSIAALFATTIVAALG